MFPWDTSNNLANFMLQQAEEIHQNNMNRIQQDMNDSTHRTNLAIVQREAEAVAFRAKNMESDLGFYRNLLTRPMNEIAQYSLEFKATYNRSRFNFTKFLLSQKAFKLTAYGLAESCGISEATVDAIMLLHLEALGENNHPTELVSEEYQDYAEIAKDAALKEYAEKYSGKIPYINKEDSKVYFKDYQEMLDAKNPKPVPQGGPIPPPGYKFDK